MPILLYITHDTTLRLFTKTKKATRGFEIEVFLFGNDKAKQRTGHLVLSDQRRPRPLVTPEH